MKDGREEVKELEGKTGKGEGRRKGKARGREGKGGGKGERKGEGKGRRGRREERGGRKKEQREGKVDRQLGEGLGNNYISRPTYEAQMQV